MAAANGASRSAIVRCAYRKARSVTWR
ncbi:hypothetical protein [Pantoea sp. PNT03]